MSFLIPTEAATVYFAASDLSLGSALWKIAWSSAAVIGTGKKRSMMDPHSSFIAELSIARILLLFLVCCSFVWICGARLASCADEISERSAVSKAFIGALLLGGVTSLPEIATTVSASFEGYPALAASNILGGVAMQFAVLAVVDGIQVRGALTYFSPDPALLMAGMFLLLELGLVVAAIGTGEVFGVWNVGLWTIIIFIVYLGALRSLQQYDASAAWRPLDVPESIKEQEAQKSGGRMYGGLSMQELLLRITGFSLVVLVAGWTISMCGAEISERSGLGASFIGATLVALSTSLPEVSTAVGAVRVGAYSMAASNIFGTNMIEIALLFISDIAYRDGYVLNALPESAAFLTAVGIVITSLYLWGMIERKNRTVLGMGTDSFLVLSTYCGSLVILYFLQ